MPEDLQDAPLKIKPAEVNSIAMLPQQSVLAVLKALVAAVEKNGVTALIPTGIQTSAFERSTSSVVLTVAELSRRYCEFAEEYYCGSHCDTTEHSCIFYAVRPLKKLFGKTPAEEFGPLRLKQVRERMIAKGWCRNHVNAQVGRIKRMFKWAVENEMIGPAVSQALQAVPGLRAGRTTARESDPVKPAPEPLVDAVLQLVSAPVKAMVQLQLLTGMRPGEVCIMRTCDIDTAVQPWKYRPSHHKTEHHHHERSVFLGPQAQELLKPFLCMQQPERYMFSPAEADKVRRERLHTLRKTPMSCGNVPGSNRKAQPKKTPGPHYNPNSYARAISRACLLAFPAPQELSKVELKKWRRDHHWHPHQLRHNAATRLRKEFGLDVAQVVLGHKTLAVTQVYAERDAARAQQVMLKAG